MADDCETGHGFGRRRPDEPAPAVTPPDRGTSKRSQTVSTVLVASAGLAALGLGSLERTAPSKDVLVYVDAAACAADGIRPAEECRSDYATARAAYPSTAPHYDSAAECEGHHGSSHCLPDPNTPPQSVSRMAGFLLGRRASDWVTPEPVYEHRQGHGGHHGNYCTGSGGKVSSGGGGHASSATLKPAAAKATQFGGFGSSGKSFSSFGGT
ncbi:UNVERIFIED_ORG: uncharacterized protein YgiB involved in biofilm formation [Methylobacterium sp. SuP10 SLI 274]|uniref:DUF1190 domain-containing protein n=1 Tax=Methylorubrum extorquens TaxID=408 RepID=UPI00209F029D|nr:DUF1190 domain-containing protein [Methylorubrum extorquens]MDF9862821.1 uncharacterized protein YgiB involved in biofilm formation [Methylorubrum pseudosasae]MDH6636432.1 uncharacterized protein YgiB involved in biofilm formation [Methylobacterium sp. SuP10 SLI 274]MDH6665611.1 uncharacterized protein YgiB involved in biofilm formation [Methylorubrum zatmanii]MCP1557529.1 uncharacterized protein YgiB involved in biofilm formation [Methylorubrum extorquens]MDF9791116.1 uncharacterized prote